MNLREGNQIIQAIQVTTSLPDSKVRGREIEGLIEAMKMYQLQEGIILTENDQETIDARWACDLGDPHLEMVVISLKGYCFQQYPFN